MFELTWVLRAVSASKLYSLICSGGGFIGSIDSFPPGGGGGDGVSDRLLLLPLPRAAPRPAFGKFHVQLF